MSVVVDCSPPREPPPPPPPGMQATSILSGGSSPEEPTRTPSTSVGTSVSASAEPDPGERSCSPRERDPWKNVYCIDVECVAVGWTHELSDRSPCAVALVDGSGQVLYNTLIRPAERIVSYLTPITGVTAKDLNSRSVPSLDEVIARIKELLPRDALLVGQNPEGDIEWMKLCKGVDFAEVVDICPIFKGFNSRFGNYSVHSLQHEAWVLLGKIPPVGAHDPAWDAQASVELYKKAKSASADELVKMQQMLINQRPRPSVAKQHNYQVDGVCMAKFMPTHCICGRPSGADLSEKPNNGSNSRGTNGHAATPTYEYPAVNCSPYAYYGQQHLQAMGPQQAAYYASQAQAQAHAQAQAYAAARYQSQYAGYDTCYNGYIAPR